MSPEEPEPAEAAVDAQHKDNEREPEPAKEPTKDRAKERAKERDDDDVSISDLPKAVRQRLETFIPELVKRGFAAGMGAVFTTEEGIRRVTKDMTLPKDVAGYLANTAGATKDEVMRILAREVREFLQSVNLSEEIAKMLTMLSFEIKTEIRFIPNDERYAGVEPDVKASVALKRSEDDSKKRRRRRRRLRDDGAE